jgi:C1A family cysteine protease
MTRPLLHFGLLALLAATSALCIPAVAAPRSSAGRQQSEEDIDRNIRRLNEKLEALGATWRAARTSLSSLTEDEFRLMFPPLPPLPEKLRRTLPVIKAPAGATFPSVWDWREMNGVTPVKDQHSPQRCGSCYAFAACAQLESFIKIYDGRNEDLSEQQVLSCHNPISFPVGGCLGGTVDRAYNLFMDPGAVSETCMVYQALDDEVPCREDVCAIHGRISGFSLVSPDENSLKLALLSGPVWVGMYIDTDFRNYGSGCFSFTTPPNPLTEINHAMLCVGWVDVMCGDGAGAWIVKNSFGTAWGDSGYVYVRFGTPTFANAAFQIDYVNEPPAPLCLKQPDGAQVWAAGSKHRIRWHCATLPVDHFEVGYRIGSEYSVIDEWVDVQSRELLWTVPERPREDCRIEITARDSSGEAICSDMSNAPFAIVTPKVEWDVSGIGVCSAAGYQGAPRIATGAPGGAIIVWQDQRNGNSDVYGQLIDGVGNALWRAGGAPICRDPYNQRNCQVACSGSVRAFVVWEDDRNCEAMGELQCGPDIYGQVIDSIGVGLENDIKICSVEGSQLNPQVVSDQFSGAIVVWEDYRERRGDSDLYAQRISPMGQLAWAASGVPICTATGAQRLAQVMSDGEGGAFVAWTDSRANGSAIYAQRIGPDGRLAWKADGVGVCTGAGSRSLQRMVPDGTGGAILIWVDAGVGTGQDIYAQRLSSSGVIRWGAAGVVVCAAPEDQYAADAAADGAGGAVVAWCDNRGEWVGEIPMNRAAGTEDIYAQKINADGNVQWAADGVGVCTLPRTQETPRIVSDGVGGAVIFWRDKRDSGWIDVGETELPQAEDNYDIFFQRIDALGNALWRENGEPFCADLTEQENICAAADPSGSAYVAWNDTRNGDRDVFMQKLRGVNAQPRCDVSAAIVRNGVARPVADDYLFGCPHGDGGDALLIRCDFRDEDMEMIGTVQPGDIVLDTGTLGFSLCDADGRDTAGTAANGYRVSLLRTCIGGCSDCCGGGCSEKTRYPQNLTVRFHNAVIGHVNGLRVKGLDVNGDGVVNGFENDLLGRVLGTEPSDSTYSSSCDYNADGVVDISDFAILGAHYGHACPRGAPPARTSPVTLRFFVAKAADADTVNRRSVSVFLENVHDVSSACFGLYNESTTLEYAGWIPSPGFLAASEAVEVTRDGRAILFVGAHRMQSVEGASVEIGTLLYNVIIEEVHGGGIHERMIGADDFVLAFGEVTDVRGATMRISGSQYEEEKVVCPNYLANCFPNPFNPATTIVYSIEERGRVTLQIFDVAGRLVKTLVDEVQEPRSTGYAVQWHGRNNAGREVSSGVYLCHLAAAGFSDTRKIVLLK